MALLTCFAHFSSLGNRETGLVLFLSIYLSVRLSVYLSVYPSECCDSSHPLPAGPSILHPRPPEPLSADATHLLSLGELIISAEPGHFYFPRLVCSNEKKISLEFLWWLSGNEPD